MKHLFLLILIPSFLFAEPDFGYPGNFSFSTEKGQLYGGAGCYTKFALWPEIIALMNNGLKGTHHEGMLDGVQTLCSGYPIHCDNWKEPYFTNQNGAVGEGNLKRFGRSIGNLCDQYRWRIDYSEYQGRKASYYKRKASKFKRKWKRLQRKLKN